MTSFVGRRQQLTEVRRRLAEARLVTLTGVGGVGKTRLALAAAEEARRAFPDGVWLVDLAGVADATAVPQTVATALSVRDVSTTATADKLVSHLHGRHLLIVLDNCEHLLQACADLVDTLLRRAPGLRVLATSRETLGVDGEHVLCVPPLSIPEPDNVPPPAGLLRYEAVKLLVDRAAALVPGFEVTGANHVAMARIVADLDGIPLAIELAATRLRSLSVDQVAARLADRFVILTGGSRAALPRQQTLRSLIDWSYSLCAEPERLLWARLSVFAGGFDLEAVEGICADASLPNAELVDRIDHLVAQSVLVAERREGRVRYRMLETIRQYGQERLAEYDDTARFQTRHRDFYFHLARRLARDWCGPDQESTLARLRAEHDNLRVAFQSFLAEPGQEVAALDLAAALRFHWCNGDRLSEGRRWLDQALTACTGPVPERATALWVTGWVAALQGDRVAMAEYLDEAQELAEQLGDASTAAYVAQNRGTAALFRGDLAAAVTYFETGIEAHRQVGSTATGILFCLFQLAAAYCHSGAPERGLTSSERALAIGEASGERWARSNALWSLSLCTWQRGDLDRAARQAIEGLRIKRGFAELTGAVLLVEMLAWIAATRGDYVRAAGYLGDARSLWRAMGTTMSAFGPDLTRHHEECEARVRHALGAAEFAAAVGHGERLSVDEAIAHALNEDMARPDSTDGGAAVPLTPREREVAELVAEGLSNRRIAESLVVSPRTVDGHVEHILTKLGFTSRAQVAAWVTEQRADRASV